MSEYVVLAILVALCVGQVIALLKGHLVAVTYYICVAPLSYFSYWKFGTWDPARLCAVILIAGSVYLYRSRIWKIHKHPILVFLAYLSLVTIIGSIFWPVEAISGKTSVYSYLRGFIQILNWYIIGGVAWQIGIALSKPGAFQKFRPTLIYAGLTHCLHAGYQVLAFYWGLPYTGIRRPASGVGADFGNEQYGHFALEGYKGLYRASSFMAEPKGLGAFLVICLCALITLYLEGTVRRSTTYQLILLLCVLGLTVSTAAWLGLVVGMVLACVVARGYRRPELKTVVLTIFLLLGGVFIFDFIAGTGVMARLHEVFDTRFLDRLRTPIGDMPEVQALAVLLSNPLLGVFGTGLGGISFYIAQNIGGGESLALFPNNGLLGFICDMGLVGLCLMFFTFRRGAKPAVLVTNRSSQELRSTSFIGCVGALCCLIHPQIWLLAFSFGALLASEFRLMQEEQMLAPVVQCGRDRVAWSEGVL